MAFELPLVDATASPKVSTKVLLQNAITDYFGSLVTTLSYKGNWDASAGTFPTTTGIGSFYIVSVAGTVDSESFAIGDWLISTSATPSTTVYTSNWSKAEYSASSTISFNTFEDLDASLSTYAEDTLVYVSEGAYLYKAAASGATNQHITTTGSSQKLYALPGPLGIGLKQLGAVGDGVANDTTIIQTWLAIGGSLHAEPGTYLVDDILSGTVSNSDIYAYGATFQATEAHFAVLGFGDSKTNFVVRGLTIDCDSVRGLNGFGIGGNAGDANNVRLIDCVVKNALRQGDSGETYSGGGRAFPVQNGASDVQIINCKAYDCSTGFDVNGQDNSPTFTPALDIIVSNFYAENCEEVASFYGQSTNSNATSPPTSPDATSILVDGVVAVNCGHSGDATLYSGAGVAGDADTGIFMIRRGANVKISNVQIRNTFAYKIGGILRGTGGNIHISNLEMWGDSVAVWVAGSADNLLPSTNTNDASYGINIQATVHGDFDHIVEVRAGSASTLVTSCNFDIEVDEFTTSNNIFDTTSSYTWRADSSLILRDRRDQKVISGRWSNIQASYNTLATATAQRTETETLDLLNEVTFQDGLVLSGGDLEIQTGNRLRFVDGQVGVGSRIKGVYVKYWDGSAFQTAIINLYATS